MELHHLPHHLFRQLKKHKRDSLLKNGNNFISFAYEFHICIIILLLINFHKWKCFLFSSYFLCVPILGINAHSLKLRTYKNILIFTLKYTKTLKLKVSKLNYELHWKICFRHNPRTDAENFLFLKKLLFLNNNKNFNSMWFLACFNRYWKESFKSH